MTVTLWLLVLLLRTPVMRNGLPDESPSAQDTDNFLCAGVVTDRRKGAGDDRRNGARGGGVKRGFERPKECDFLLDFATAFSPFSGIGLGLRKLSPSMTMR